MACASLSGGRVQSGLTALLSRNAPGALQIEELPQPAGLRAADWNFGLLFVGHAELIARLEPGNHFADVVDVDEEGAVGAPEDCGVEQIEELLESAAFRLAFDGGGYDGNDAVVDGGEADVLLIDEEEAAASLENDFAAVRFGRLMLLDELEQRVDTKVGGGKLRFSAWDGLLHAEARAFDSLQDAVAIEGLEQVVDGVDVEGADRVLVVGSRKDDLRQLLAFAQFQQLF